MEDSSRRTVRLPFAFGDVVYHRVREDKVAGIITGFHIRPTSIVIAVTWGDNLAETMHYFHELTTEYEPIFSAES